MAALELALEPGDVARLVRLRGVEAGRSVPMTIAWHDTPDRALAGDGLSLAVASRRWRLERLALPGPGQPPAVLGTASQPGALGVHVPDGLAEAGRLQGRRRTMRRGGVTLEVVAGAGHARLVLAGPGPEVAALAQEIAAALPVRVPRASLAAELLGVAPCRGGAGALAEGLDVNDAIGAVMSPLLEALLRWPGQLGGAGPEPVHQMRVATRRLRSALTVFRQVAAGPELEGLRQPLHTCAGTLGAARDWDVFLEGTAARLAAAFPGDKRVAALLRAARRRRREAYAGLQAYVASPEFRMLTVGLAAFAALRPWPEAPHEAVESFAAEALAKRARQVRKAGRGIEELPVEALHELRKDCKKLRYTADFFASLFPARPARRYLKRLAALQEALGRLNDGAAVSALLAQLGRAERSFAGGLVEGFAAARAGPVREDAAAAWHRFRKVARFWPG